MPNPDHADAVCVCEPSTVKEHAKWLRDIAHGGGIGPGYAVHCVFSPDNRDRLRAIAALLDSLADEPVADTHTSRDWPEDASHENGNYFCNCCLCGCEFTGHKRRVVCKECHTKATTGLTV